MISDKIGENWVYNLDELQKLEDFINDNDFKEQFRNAKWLNKKLLINVIEGENGIKINPDSIFDVMVKRLHEYKRQLLNF